MNDQMTEAEIRSEWVRLLRSGTMPQGHGWLESVDGYCCLGVLCVALGVDPSAAALSSMRFINRYDGPVKGYKALMMHSDTQSMLSILNDHHKWSFEQFAKLIEGDPDTTVEAEETLAQDDLQDAFFTKIEINSNDVPSVRRLFVGVSDED